MWKKLWLPSVIIFAIIGIDRLVKVWASNVLKNLGTLSGINGIFAFTYTENRGAAFSLFENKRIFLLLVTIAAIIWLVCILTDIQNTLGRLAIYFIIGGAIGNLLDRIFLGYVVDMFEFSFVNFAIFNIADCFVSIGTVMLVIYLLVYHKDDRKKVTHHE